MASKFPTDVLSACLQNFDDARVLSCLHSVCKACIDKMAVTATDGVITCPICRASTRLPQSGAAGLPKNVFVPTKDTREHALECGMCDDDKTRKKLNPPCGASNVVCQCVASMLYLTLCLQGAAVTVFSCSYYKCSCICQLSVVIDLLPR